MNRLENITADIAMAKQTIPNGDITTEPGASILAARLRLQNEHAPELLAAVQEVAARHRRTDASEDPEWRDVTGLRDAYCAHCLADWPCPDARAVQALTETTEETTDAS